ncbi:hypothetical protein SAMN02745911_0791 [Aureimonas altamirensis DSM 21988]|uniref:Uncharacterized protein n=1 Tax=Aureimonas altamirensis DSM 21988 TaxID=1121026 RepID=A0ABY1I6B8_9HYPH|nr:hypothetical protein [Aureimonas altamirensis]SHI66228.1 hypothetical protein SAMN02745911_0791 [Aureimonas altamirensis DSM 21988]
MMLNRRRFLFAAFASLAVPGVFEVARTARAAQRGSGLGLNLVGLPYWTTEHPFTNLAASASRWRVQRVNAPFTWDDPLPPMTDDRYPRTIPPGTFLESFLIHTKYRSHLPSNLTVRYDGRGRIGYYGGAVLLDRGEGFDRIRINHTDAPVIARLYETDPDNPLHNLRLLEQADGGGDLFREAFLNRLEGMQALRFMDWGQTNDSPLQSWDQRPKPGMFDLADRGIPVETMVALANRTGIAPWFTIPHLADDNYAEQMAQLVREQLDPALPLYVEYSNEVWNEIFKQAAYAREEGLRLGLSSDPFEAQLKYHGQRSSEVIWTFRRVFGADAKRVKGVFAGQAENPWTVDVVLSSQQARDNADLIAIAPYFGYSYGTPDRAKDVSQWSLDRLFAELEKDLAGRTRDMMRAQSETAKRLGLPLAAYEAGQHLAGVAGQENDERLVALFIAANRDPRMGQLYRTYLDSWKAAGGGLMVLYTSMYDPGKWGSWGLLEHEGETTSPKWEAVHGHINA